MLVLVNSHNNVFSTVAILNIVLTLVSRTARHVQQAPISPIRARHRVWIAIWANIITIQTGAGIGPDVIETQPLLERRLERMHKRLEAQHQRSEASEALVRQHPPQVDLTKATSKNAATTRMMRLSKSRLPTIQLHILF